jgi:integrase
LDEGVRQGAVAIPVFSADARAQRDAAVHQTTAGCWSNLPQKSSKEPLRHPIYTTCVALHALKAARDPLGAEVRTKLKAHRHLRGPYVFCDTSGELLGTVDTRHPLWRACKKAGLRQIGWHALRHPFASHLVMRGASMKAVQELLGHSSIQMTMRYAHLAPEVVNETVRLLDAPSAEWVPRLGQRMSRAVEERR